MEFGGRPGSGNEWYTTLDAELTKISNSDDYPTARHVKHLYVGGPTFKYPTDIRRSFQLFPEQNCPLSVRHTQACQIRPICVRYAFDIRPISVGYPSDIRRIFVGYLSDMRRIRVGYLSVFCPIYPSGLDNCCEPLSGPSNVSHLNSMGAPYHRIILHQTVIVGSSSRTFARSRTLSNAPCAGFLIAIMILTWSLYQAGPSPLNLMGPRAVFK